MTGLYFLWFFWCWQPSCTVVLAYSRDICRRRRGTRAVYCTLSASLVMLISKADSNVSSCWWIRTGAEENCPVRCCVCDGLPPLLVRYTQNCMCVVWHWTDSLWHAWRDMMQLWNSLARALTHQTVTVNDVEERLEGDDTSWTCTMCQPRRDACHLCRWRHSQTTLAVPRASAPSKSFTPAPYLRQYKEMRTESQIQSQSCWRTVLSTKISSDASHCDWSWLSVISSVK